MGWRSSGWSTRGWRSSGWSTVGCLGGSSCLPESKSKELEPVIATLQAGGRVGDTLLEERGSKIPQSKRGATRATRGAVPWTQGSGGTGGPCLHSIAPRRHCPNS